MPDPICPNCKSDRIDFDHAVGKYICRACGKHFEKKKEVKSLE